MASGPSLHGKKDGETTETVTGFILGGSKITADGHCSHEVKMLAPWKKSHDQRRQHIKKQRHYFVNKGPSNCQASVFFLVLSCLNKNLK